MPRKKSTQKSHYHKLKQKWLKRHKVARKELFEKHKEAMDFVLGRFPAKDKIASAAIGALMLSSTMPATSSAVLEQVLPEVGEQEQPKTDKTQELVSYFSEQLPGKVRPLNDGEEAEIGELLSGYFEMGVSASIDGKRLNRTWGMIGAEQHLVRFPGDNMAIHLPKDLADYRLIYSSGMAPGRGAWGYFANSKAELSEKDIEREKWYIAVQTFAAPDYNRRLGDYRGFFKYRKMLIVNPNTGQAIVCDIADAGPAIWTGKHLGGSPEVMYHLGLARGSRKGGVLYFFVDDPDDTIPLGPVKPYGEVGNLAKNE